MKTKVTYLLRKSIPAKISLPAKISSETPAALLAELSYSSGLEERGNHPNS